MPESNGEHPVTRAELKTELATLEQRLRAAQTELEERLVERIRDAQTEILRGFERYSHSQDIRLRKVEPT